MLLLIYKLTKMKKIINNLSIYLFENVINNYNI
jgi:hypothetical protein